MVFAIRIRNNNMLFTGSGVLQNPQCLHTLRSASHDLYKFELTANDLVPEDHCFSRLGIVMSLRIFPDYFSILFNFECTGCTVCHQISIICFCFLNCICTVRKCFILCAGNILSKFLIVISLDRCNHRSRRIFHQFSGIRENR